MKKKPRSKIIWTVGCHEQKVTYKVLYKNHKLKKGELIGTLIERRRDLRGKSQLESGLSWAKAMFGQTVENKHMIFVIPDESKVKNDS